MHKCGREFSIAVMENHDGRVSERVRFLIHVRVCLQMYLCAGRSKVGHCYAFARARQCIFGRDSQGIRRLLDVSEYPKLRRQHRRRV